MLFVADSIRFERREGAENDELPSLPNEVIAMPLLPTARAVEAYTLRNAEDFAYMKDVAYRTGGFGLGLGLELA